MTEKEFMAKVVETARTFGWMAVHFGGDQHGRAWYDAAGFPDLLLVNAERNLIWFRELKSETGRLTARQTRCIGRLEDAGLNVDVWRPDDWPDIVTALSNGTARATEIGYQREEVTR